MAEVENLKRDSEDPLYAISFENSRLEEENKNLKRTIEFYQTELEKFRRPPFIVTEILSKVNEDDYIVKLPSQSNFLVQKSSQFKEKIDIGDMVINEQKSLLIVGKVDLSRNFPVENFLIVDDKPLVSWEDIGGLSKEIEKVKEVLELPLLKPKIFEEMGIIPPKGVLLYGPAGTGKTLIAKALARGTNATFMELVASELVQKFIGDGARLVKELFDFAKKRGPTIIFIDEIDALASKRIETGTSGEREVQRTFMQLLGELDGFDALSNVKVIAATNRFDILDDAITRPGRLERHIEIGVPNKRGREEILKIHTKRMKLSKDVNLKEIAKLTQKFKGAELKAVCTEAGYEALRNKNKYISQKHFLKAVKIIEKSEKSYKILNHSYN